MTHGWSTVEVNTQQHGRVQDYVGDYNPRISTTLAESNAATKAAVMGIDLSTFTNAQSENVTYYTVTKQLRERRLAVLHLNEQVPSPFKLQMTVFPKVKRTGSDSEWSWDRDAQLGLPLEFNAYADEDIQDPTTGQYVYAYDIDQP